MTSKAFQRGMRAKQKGRSLDRNPFKKRAGRSNAKKAEEWEEGWHAAEVRTVLVPKDWKWPELHPYPHPQAGDYGVRERGLLAFFRPKDLIEYEILLIELRGGNVSHIPLWAAIPFDLLRTYGESKGWFIQCQDPGPLEDEIGFHPMKYLWTALRIQGSCSRWPTLVVSAYEEIIYGTVSALLPSPRRSSDRSAGDAGDDEGE